MLKAQIEKANLALQTLEHEKKARDLMSHIRLKEELMESHQEEEKKLQVRIAKARTLLEEDGKLVRKMVSLEAWFQKHGQTCEFSRDTFELSEWSH